MGIKNVVRAFTASLVVCALAEAQVTRRQSAPEDPESLRQILANQPDYTAVRWDFFSRGGFSGGAKLGRVVKMGGKLVEVLEDTIVIREPGKPTVKVFPKRKEYAEVPAEERDDSAGPPEELTNPEKVARDSHVVFRSAGVEKVGGHTCLKILATHKNEKYKAVKLTFWVAPGLKNLVIQSEVAVTRPAEGRVRFLTTFEDISLDVNGELFRVPQGYKKVAESARPEGPGDKMREGWVVFSPEGGGFSVMLPGEPTQGSLRRDAAAGPATSLLYEVTSGGLKYVVSYTDYPFSAEGAERDKLLDMGAEAGITGAGGKVASNKPISLGDHPGREVKGETKGFLYQSRVYLVKQRLYLLIVWQPPGGGGSEEADKFLDSFKLVAQ